MSIENNKSVVKVLLIFWVPDEEVLPDYEEMAEVIAEGIEHITIIPGLVLIQGVQHPIGAAFYCEFCETVHPDKELGTKNEDGYICKACIEKANGGIEI